MGINAPLFIYLFWRIGKQNESRIKGSTFYMTRLVAMDYIFLIVNKKT